MAYSIYGGAKDMVAYYVHGGVETKIYEGNLLTFPLDLTRALDLKNELESGGATIDVTISPDYYKPGDAGDWTYFIAESIKSSSCIKGSWIYLNCFKDGSVGDKIYWCNKNNRNYKLGIEYVGPQTHEGGTYYVAKFYHEFPGITGSTGDFALAGIDAYGRSRDSIWGFMADRENGYACPYILLEARAQDNTSGTVNVNNVYAWINASRSQYNSTYRYLYYNVFAGALPEPSEDPYEPGGTSETQEPAGTFDDTSDQISVPSVPALNLSLSHFMSAYSPGIGKINDLADWLWGDYSGIDRHIAKFFADPTDAIISLHMVPFTPDTSSDIEVTIGRYGTLINMPPITNQFKDVDCGSLTIEPYWDNYLDYNPYTRLTLALPYVGEVQLDPDEVMGETVNVLYRVDVLSGAFVCFISTATKVLAQYTGNCSLSVPISSASYAQANAAIMQLAVSAVGLGTSAVGYSAALEAGTAKEIAKAGAQVTEASVSAGSSAMSVLNAKVNHSHSGSIAGTAGFLGIQKPYLLIHRARQSVPEYANKFHGYPCNVTMTLADLTGYTSVKNIVLDDLPFTKGELDSLRGILAAGVYL